MRATAVALLLVVAAACGSDDDASPSTSPPADTGAAVTTAAPSTAAPEMAPTVTAEPQVTTSSPATPTTPAPLEQPAIWPAADVVFESPEEAAEDFVAEVLGVPPALGEFRQGDSRSGEIEVFSPGEGGAAMPIPRSLLLLRQLGPNDGWFVLAAINENASIESPEAGAVVHADELAVSGVARGFEANVNVTARVAGVAIPLDEEITMGGSTETPEPFSVTLDLTSATAGEVIMLLVRGGVGLETDPGDFGAIAVIVD